MTILYALLVLLDAVLVTTITFLYDLTIYIYSFEMGNEKYIATKSEINL